MDLSRLKPAKGSTHSETRIGRGQGSGKGGTSTKGHKGGQSRSGHKTKFGFEGGQMPLSRRLPKFGFNNINRVEYKPVNVSTLESLAKEKNLSIIDIAVLREAGLIPKNCRVKVLGNGNIETKLEVKAHGFSKKAQAAIEACGGKIEVLA